MATILVVDDELASRKLLRSFLADGGHTLFDVASGDEAIALVEQQPLDLVLLDVLMPKTDGFATVVEIKRRAAQDFLPVVLITALSDPSSRRRGLLAGADDFLVKPVDPEELTLRLRNLLALREHARALRERNAELLGLQREREEVAALLVHDVKNPLGVIQACVDFALEAADGEAASALEDALTACERMQRLLDGLALTHRAELGTLELQRAVVDVEALLERAAALRRWDGLARRVSLSCAIEGPLPALDADGDLLERVLENLVGNALRHTPEGGDIVLAARASTRGLRIEVGNSGTPIPPPLRERVFEKYFQAEGQRRRRGLGLGLYFCRLAILRHGGAVWVEERGHLATVVCIDLPL